MYDSYPSQLGIEIYNEIKMKTFPQWFQDNFYNNMDNNFLCYTIERLNEYLLHTDIEWAYIVVDDNIEIRKYEFNNKHNELVKIFYKLEDALKYDSRVCNSL